MMWGISKKGPTTSMKKGSLFRSSWGLQGRARARAAKRAASLLVVGRELLRSELGRRLVRELQGNSGERSPEPDQGIDGFWVLRGAVRRTGPLRLNPAIHMDFDVAIGHQREVHHVTCCEAKGRRGGPAGKVLGCT